MLLTFDNDMHFCCLKAIYRFEESVDAQSEWRQFHHLCYWELMWCHRLVWLCFSMTAAAPFFRVPTAPGNLEKLQVFPALEKYWNFIILFKILEKWEWTWKNELSGEKIVLSWLLQHSFLLYRALPIKMYIWEKFWDSWASVVFSDGRVYGAIRLGMLLDSKKGDRASAISCPTWVT